MYQRLIVDYKYGRKPVGWALIFGRLLVGHLQAHWAGTPLPYHLIVAAPSYPTRAGTRFHHTERVIEAAEREDLLGLYPFDVGEPRAIVKEQAAPQSAGAGLEAREQHAREVAEAMRVPDHRTVAGKRVLVYDDVFTSGWTLHAVAWILRQAGAAHVDGVVLARQPW